MTEDFVPKLSFTSREYETIAQELLDFVRVTRPNAWSDFAQSNLGTTLVQLVALVGDMLSFGQDQVAAELFLSTCRRYGSALRFAKSVGYVPRLATAATVVVKSLTVPAPLITDGGTIPAGTKIRGQNNLVYEVVDDFIIDPGTSVIRVPLKQGTSFSETFNSTSQQNQVITVANGGVEDGSWEVFVGDPTQSTNRWEQVENVDFEDGPTKTYDVFFDDLGRLNIRFGNGTSGLIPNDTITTEYRITDGEIGNSPDASIRGTMKINLTTPGVGTVSVEFVNHDDIAAISGGTQLQSDESQGATITGATQGGTLGNIPVVASTAVITINLTGGGGTVVLTDNGAGVFTITTNTTALALVSSAITYSTGAWSAVFDAPLVAGGTMAASYYSIEASTTGASTSVGAAQGGTDRESLEEMRLNVPAYIRSQDKILTASDYNDVLPKLAGIALSFVDIYVASYTSNLVKVNVWSSETVTFQSEDSSGTLQSQAAYQRYVQVGQDQVNRVQDYLRDRTLLTVHNVVLRPEMLWVDLYLGTVSYDRRVDVADVRLAITEAIVDIFESGTGFVIRLSDIYDAVRTSTGVKHFTLLRAATGTQATSSELQGTTAASDTMSGTLLLPIVSPGSVEITLQQTDTTSIVIGDDGAGGWTLLSGSATIDSGTVDYRTGAWTVTFTAALLPNQEVLASYANVTDDMRHDQIVGLNTTEDNDAWPPPGVGTTEPITTPPYKDGLPLSATRAGVAQAPPYISGDVLTYKKIQDIIIATDLSQANLYDNTFLFNNEIYYDSVTGLTTALRAINLRRLIFDLTPV